MTERHKFDTIDKVSDKYIFKILDFANLVEIHAVTVARTMVVLKPSLSTNPQNAIGEI